MNSKEYWPQDTARTAYIIGRDITLEDVNDVVAQKWPGASPADISVSAEEIQTYCIGYDLYHDPSDYTPYIVITYEGDNPDYLNEEIAK